jgi:hypothetical protein
VGRSRFARGWRIDVIRGPAGFAQAGFFVFVRGCDGVPMTLLRGGGGPGAPATGAIFRFCVALCCILSRFVALEMLGIWRWIFGFVENKAGIWFEW